MFSQSHSNTKSSSLADILSDLGNSLQFTLAASSSAVTQHRGTSSDPEHHVCCAQVGKHGQLVLCEYVCTASVAKLADSCSGCGEWSQLCPPAARQTHGGAAHPSPRGCRAGALLLLLLALCSCCCWHHPRVLSPGLPPRAVQVRKKKVRLKSGAGTSPNLPLLTRQSVHEVNT